MTNVFILKWIFQEGCESECSVDFIYMLDDSIFLSSVIFKNEDFEKFKKNRNKNKLLSQIISDDKFIINEEITYRYDLEHFIKNEKLESKIRSYKIKRLLR